MQAPMPEVPDATEATEVRGAPPRRVWRPWRPWVEAYSGLSPQVWWIALATFVNRSGSMVLPFLMLWLVRERGTASDHAGALVSLYGLGAIGSGLLGGVLVDRLGPKRVAVGSLAAGGLGFFALGTLRHPTAIGIGLLVQGFVYEMLRPATSAALAAHARPETRTRAMAASRLAVNLGGGCGLMLGGWLAVHDYAWIFRVDGATSLAAALCVGLALESDVRKVARGAALAAWRGLLAPIADPRFACFALLTLLVALVFFQVLGTWSLYLSQQGGLAESTIGWVLAVNNVQVVALEMLIVHKLERRPPLYVAACGALVTGAGFGLLAFGAGLPLALASLVVFTMGEMLTVPFLAGWVARWGDEARRGAAFGLFHLSFSTACMLAPAAGTALYDNVSPAAPWWACAVVGSVAAAGLAGLARARRAAA
jgi:predicted MFS family arabinose efflux permease